MAVSREYLNLSNDELRTLALGQRGNAEALNKISLELSFRSSRSARRLAEELPELVTGEAETEQEQDLEPGPAPAQEVAQQRCKPRGTWETTPPEIMQALFVNGVDYDEQELEDLGWPDSESPFTPDTSLQEFRSQEQAFRETHPERHLSWWSSRETRSLAWWKLRLRPNHRQVTREWDSRLKQLGYRIGDRSSEHLNLAWLTSVPQERFDEWRQLHESHGKLLSSLARWIDRPEQALPSDLPAGCSVEDALQHRVKALTAREQSVLRMRFGLDGEIKRTLDDTATAEGNASGRPVTRERIRQIESKALRKVGSGIEAEFAQALLRPAVARFRRTLRVIPLSEAKGQVLRSLTPLERLLSRACTYDLAAWLVAQVGRPHGNRFLVGGSEPDQIVSLAVELDEPEAAAEIPLPVPFERFRRQVAILEEHTPEVGRQAIEASAEFALEADFVVSHSRPKAQLDAINLWRRMQAVGGYTSIRFLGTRPPIGEPKESVPDFLSRDRSACKGFPHLFMKVCDDAVLALTLDGAMLGSRQPADAVDPHPWRPQEGTAVDLLSKTLRKLGVARFAAWREATQQASARPMPQGTMQALSTVRTDLFLRVAPGTYASPDVDLSDHLEKLVDSHQIQLYLDARMAGEPPNSYRAWTPELELEWCRWARAHEPSLYRALLHFCAIDEWHCSAEDLAWWTDEKHRLGRAPLPSGPRAPTVAPSTINPSELLEMICMIALDGGINQLRVNRSLGRRPEIRTTWAYLALLVASGFLEDSDSWHAWHESRSCAAADADIGQLRQDLLEERSKSGTVSRNSKAFSHLLQRASTGLANNRCQWLTGFPRKALIADLYRHTYEQSRTVAPVHEGHSTDLDLLLQEALADELAASLDRPDKENFSG